jgi:hypothetical protein
MNKGVLAVVVVFFGFWMFTDPHGLAQFTQSTGDSVAGWGQKLFSSLIAFLGDL